MATSQQLTATLKLSNGDTETVTSTATWASGDPEVATVSSGGLVTAVGEGSTTITATAQGKSGTCEVSVTNPPEALTVNPSSTDLTVS